MGRSDASTSKGARTDVSVNSSRGAHVADPSSRRRVEPLFAEPSAYFRSDFPGLDQRRQSLNERDTRATHPDGPQRPRTPSAHGSPGRMSWEPRPLRSWPVL
jgi:hypothetical protein